MTWRNLPGFESRNDLGEDVVGHCPRLFVTSYSIEWIRLYRETQAGIVIDARSRTPMWRRTMEALRVEDALQAEADREERERARGHA